MKTIKGEMKRGDYKIAIISSRFNTEITGNLIEGAKKSFLENEYQRNSIDKAQYNFRRSP